MSKLNEKTHKTEKIIHIMTTSLCNRNCENCCNKQYNLNDIPYVTDAELQNANTICLTGGEPFLFSNPCEIANYYKWKYRNISSVYVYANAFELGNYLCHNGKIFAIDGVSVSIKTGIDRAMFDRYIVCNNDIANLSSNRLYVFDGLRPKKADGFVVVEREWQSDFVPADDSIFRKC